MAYSKESRNKFMNFLAKLESVAPSKDREAINQVRGLFAKYEYERECEEKK